MKELETPTAGMHISQVAKEAIEAAQTEDLFFKFNGFAIPVTKTSTVESICSAYDEACKKAAEDYEGSPEQLAAIERRKQEAINARKKLQGDIALLVTADEAALRDISLRPERIEDLLQIYNALSERSHDYGTCVYAMSIIAESSFNLMASKLGVTGFQASCADLDIIRRTRSIAGPFALLLGNDMLYPQYDVREKAAEHLAKWESWAADEAKKLIANKSEHAHPDVLAHWESLASKASATDEPQIDEKKSD